MSGFEITLIAIAFLALLLNVVAFWQIKQTNTRFQQVLGSSFETGEPFEDGLRAMFKKLLVIDRKLNELQSNYSALAFASEHGLQKVAIVRFNPFRNTGGDQSFVLALLDGTDSGMLVTSIHSRDGTRMYIKPVESGASEYTLSEEEASALKQAKQQTKPKENHEGTTTK